MSSSSNSNTFNTAARAISVGWIVGIVIICLSLVVFGALAIMVMRRNQSRRRAREQNAQTGYDNPQQTYAYGNYGGQSHCASNGYAPMAQNQYPEMGGSAAPPRFEAASSEVPYREAPNTEVARSMRPQHDAPRSELGGTEPKRTELP
ncbi:hypothetical protein F5Y15DRAFT_60415 [Xylariaceae sp. FL0016]|nr:hypothetical protein F5Y15DRAFT_60415 [Xylariaceae sp. FL0016]